MLTRRAVLQKCLALGPVSVACGLVAAVILAPFQERGHATPQSAHETTQSPASAYPLILQEADGEHRVGRPPFTNLRFTIKVDEQNGNAQDFYVGTTLMPPGATLPFHMHHNAEELLIFEEGGATVTVGDKRAVAGPHSIVFIPRETWVSVTNTSTQSIHSYGIFSRQGFETYARAISVLEGQPATPLNPADEERLRALGHATYWDTSKGPYPPGVAHP